MRPAGSIEAKRTVREQLRSPVRRGGAAALLVALLLAGAGVETAPARGRGTPMLVLEAPVFDFGAVDQGAVVRHAFRLHNAGDGDLHIEGVHAPCGCTAGIISERVVPPGGEGSVEVTFDTTGFGGRKTKTLSLWTNDSAEALHELTLTGEVRPKLVADPPMVYLGRIRPGSEATGEVRVLKPSGERIKLAEVTAKSPGLDLAIVPGANGDGGRRVAIRLAGDVRGRFSNTLRILTTDPELPTLYVPVFGSVESDLTIVPSQLTFDDWPGGRRSRRYLVVSNRGPKPVWITGVHVGNLPMDYAVKTVDAGYEYRISMRLMRPTLSTRGTVRIYTTHPDEPELVVPLSATVDADGP
jgi:hypothetical protein